MITRTAHGKSLTGGFQRAPSDQACGLVDTAAKGRGGDTELAHVNPQEAAVLKAMGGSGTVNPNTGLREYVGGGPGSQSESDAGSTHRDAFSVGGDVFGDGRGPPSGDLFGDASAFASALGQFQAGGNPEMGPRAQAYRGFIDRAQPSAFESVMGRLPGMAIPGVQTEMRPNYIAGQPELAASFNPIGAAASFMNPLGFDPKGDLMSPGFADVELGATKRSDPYEVGAGKGGAFEETPRWRQMADQLIRGVLRG